MPPKKKRPKKKNTKKAICPCGDACYNNDAHLPGYLLIALGLLVLPINFGLAPGLDWIRAWPLFLVLFGAVMVAKVFICRFRR